MTIHQALIFTASVMLAAAQSVAGLSFIVVQRMARFSAFSRGTRLVECDHAESMVRRKARLSNTLHAASSSLPRGEQNDSDT
ncbi:MAG: hypothetical protein Q9169_007454, partial [Polycauliona sp. 2 TL-2023]